MDTKISVIMPCYYSSEIIRQALTMLSWQTRKDAIEVIMINDCSPNTNCKYADLLEEFSDKLNIKYFENETNRGPGYCRQVGIDNSSARWAMFHDDDDMLNNIYVIETLISIIEMIPEDMIITNIYSPNLIRTPADSRFILAKRNGLGSLINLDIVKKFNVRFSELSYEEDCLFGICYDYYCCRLRALTDKTVCALEISDLYKDFIGYTKQTNNLSICSVLTEEKRIVEAVKYLTELLRFYYSLPADSIAQNFLQRNFGFTIKYMRNWFNRASFFNIDKDQKDKIQEMVDIFNSLLNKYSFLASKEEKEEVNNFLKMLKYKS